MPRTLGDRGNKLLADAKKASKNLSRQRLGQLPSASKYDKREITIRRLEIQPTELTRILLADYMIEQALGVGEGPSKTSSEERGDGKYNDTWEEDFPLETIHMIGGPHHPDLANKI